MKVKFSFNNQMKKPKKKVLTFSDNPPAKETVVAANQLTRMIQQASEDGCDVTIDLKKAFQLNGLDVVDQICKMNFIEKQIESGAFKCTQEPMFKLQVI